MLSAFTARPLVQLKQRDKSRIESFLAYGDRLLVGLNTGTLRIYRINELNHEHNGHGESQTDGPREQENGREDVDANGAALQNAELPNVKPTDLLREQEKFSRYKIEQLAIIKEAGILLSLSNGYVSIHDLQTYELQQLLARTKGASAFAVTSNIVKDPCTGVPSIVSRLAVAVKRKLMLWMWLDMELEDDTAEITLASGIKTLTWTTGTKLVAGLNSTYVMVDVETSKVTDIVGPGSIGGPGGQETSRLGGVGVASMSYIGMGGAAPKPLATRLGDGETLLAKDVNTHFIDTDGNSLGRRQIPWTTGPEAVGYSYPYLLALQEPSKGTLEVRNPETLSLLQSISLPSASMLHIPQPTISLAHAGKGFLVGSERTIWRMGALDYDSQIDSLIEEGHLDEAISLISMLEDALLKDKPGRLRQAKLQKAQALFDKQKYRDSLDLFTEACASPEMVIHKYPKIIAGPLSTFDEEKSEEDSSDADDQTSQKTNGTAANSVDATAESMPKAKSPAGYAPSVRSFLRGKSEDASETGSIRGKPPDMKPVDKPLQGKDLKTAAHALQGFLADIRRRLQRFLNPDGTVTTLALQLTNETDDFTQSMRNVLGLSPDDTSDDIAKKLRETATLVDTTLFRAHMFATPSLAGSLFRIANFCDPDVVMEKLEETGRYNDLIDFLFGKRLHRPALELLQKFGQAEADEEDTVAAQLRGPERTVTYLQNLPPEMIDLILEFAEWPVRTRPELGMEIFLADTENAETLQRDRVLEFLQNIDAKLAIRYLEHVIGELNEMSPDLHQRLLSLYLDRLKRWKEEEISAQQEFENEEEWRDCREKFLHMLKDSEQYSPARMLDRLPREDPEFFEPRAILFSKMGQHRQALEIYVFKLESPDKAEEYCNYIHRLEEPRTIDTTTKRVSPTDNEDGHPSIYHTLLSLYLSPPHNYKPQYGPAIEILARHGSRLPAGSTLDLIPETFPVHELEFYFRGRMRAANSVGNEARIVAALRKVQNIAVQADLQLGEEIMKGNNKGRNRFVTISEERVCGVCHKRLGGSVISVFPNNTVVHLGCAGKWNAAPTPYVGA
ncbi:6-phosphofructo-2-kinase/fructose-2,6-bisphosphatase [Blastomyces gilchristii SLH14081]|uniref:6-phosphofructo-2-kinase/fructose-2, 6-bisphosphatase n=1 Tax=Blastomyces gilchristii (strain SLH14081) TaxID=559298 RepID=A0A179UUF9_BLAGS|nr:6-phosphofructo-2-kinase/fructose-2,6-bisphosphatase [Blastomyces gilchristii SLH14081]EQL38308.1 6-phosphofructo-2-kinase/fructose-2,6-bisphosphatase [Blastomyces dermatitidis ATCC 26199]OAT10042.1 6-phosphofructo-2-kinase/fructose-2,6-bisphosphatase [Blastomyces gilchristii SLH14081]